MRITENQLRRVIKKLVSEQQIQHYGRAEDFVSHYNDNELPGGSDVMAPGSVSQAPANREAAMTKTQMFLDAWEAAGGVWRFGEAKRFYNGLGGASLRSMSMTVVHLLEKYGFRVTDENGKPAWQLNTAATDLDRRVGPTGRW